MLSFTDLSVGFTTQFLDGPINDTIVKTARVTDIEFIEYSGFSGHASGDTPLVKILDDLIIWLHNATIAADLLRDFLNDVYLPNWDLTPL